MMRNAAIVAAVILPVALSEWAASRWMHPARPADASARLPVLELSMAADWPIKGELYQEVQPSLKCSTGWITDIEKPDLAGMRVAYFAWDDTSTVSTLEAFKHLPEQCMGSIGMKLDTVSPSRRMEIADTTLVFDSTSFRPRGGGTSVHVFKCVWVEGLAAPDLREDALGGTSGREVRRLRLAAATTRFKPRHTRVIMGSVVGMPTEDLAWRQFSAAIRDRITLR